MDKYQKFYFEDFMFDVASMQAKFYYSFDKIITFEEVIDFDDPAFDLRADLDFDILENILFHLHIALGISYYKLFPTKQLIVESGKIDDFQKRFWKKFYQNGLGEFLYTNKISPDGLFDFVSNGEAEFLKKDFITQNRALVPIGGGKDSLVTMELIKDSGLEYELFVFGKEDDLKKNCAKTADKTILLTQRSLSKTLFELNKQGYYNGHVPITGIIAFIMQATAYLYDYKYSILSNEKSANYSNTTWEGLDINHQYSKSLEFEKDFGEYVNKYISSDLKYFSLLRGMFEQKIAEIFSQKAKEFFGVFSSCNNNFKIEKKSDKLEGKSHPWCNKCPKCAFVFSILSAYISRDELINIFGSDLYKDETLEELFKELLGIYGMKPFECVGTNEEVVYSMYQAYIKNKEQLPYMLKMFEIEIIPTLKKEQILKIENKLLKIYDEDIIPVEIKEKIALFK